MKRDPNDAKRLVYCFVKKDTTESLFDGFYKSNTQVEPNLYHKSVREIGKVLRENMDT